MFGSGNWPSSPSRNGFPVFNLHSSSDPSPTGYNQWAPIERSSSPIGINGLSPQSDDVVQSPTRNITHSVSPIGVESPIFNRTPPAHMRGLFK